MRPNLRLSASLFAFVVLAVAARPQDLSSSAPAAVPHLEFEKYTLPNGLQVILHVDRKLPMVHVNSWYHVGSKNERVGRTGFAHLFEHMMFEGSKDANTKYFSFIEKAGANLFEGGVNGTTNEDRTNYFESVPSGSLELAVSAVRPTYSINTTLSSVILTNSRLTWSVIARSQLKAFAPLSPNGSIQTIVPLFVSILKP